jgi:hypothetical protein
VHAHFSSASIPLSPDSRAISRTFLCLRIVRGFDLSDDEAVRA